ncbi:S41 family peptidase [Pedobacter duraquae]|uniref:Carboxyl-terminal processing protease n=1 Tax=Pedobacter duraquae TaxID=425511 RepID=A0A4R6ICE4_9SPHI|nr:S41 family peptidase [Pedobacter duraquae]TDO19514.1 carboxyl-terminal processing protease [Pedobacter duraquae]
MNKNTRQNLLIALTYSVTLIGGMYLGYRFLKDQGFTVQRNVTFAENNDEKVDEIIHIINKNYVDEVNADTLNHLPIDSILHQLDPHSMYLPPAKAYEQSEMLEGNFEGIGIEYYLLNDTLLVTNVFKDGPAYAAGLKLGDKILKVDSNFVSGHQLPREQMIGKIKGRRGTPVQLSVLHNNATVPVMMTIKRDKVRVSTIDAAYMLNPETAYIRISKFGANTDLDFVDAIRVLKAKGMSKLVLDLRDNGGGYLTAATGLANQLLPENKLIVYTEGKHEPRTDYIATGGGEFEQGKLAILINENTASASEILAGAVQDLDRGIIIGRRSFGKGLVQEQFPFGDGSALNLTIARYYTPLGRSIQKSYKKGYAAYQSEIDERYSDGELTDRNRLKDSIKSLKSVNKTNAYVTASGKKVFGGGGITPDLYVKMDTVGINRFYNTLITKKVLFDYVYDVLANRYTATSLEHDINHFNISDTDYKDLIRYIQNKHVEVDPKQLAQSKPVILNDLKVLLYKYYLGDTGYYKALNVNDKMVKQALLSLQ